MSFWFHFLFETNWRSGFDPPLWFPEMPITLLTILSSPLLLPIRRALRWTHALQDWASAGLKTSSTVRMLLATIADSRVVLHVGRLSDADWNQVKQRITQVFTWS